MNASIIADWLSGNQVRPGFSNLADETSFALRQAAREAGAKMAAVQNQIAAADPAYQLDIAGLRGDGAPGMMLPPPTLLDLLA